jgi:hypothetical protein
MSMKPWLALLVALAVVQAAPLRAKDSEGGRELLQTGKLRVGINMGSRLTRAVGADIGRDLAHLLEQNRSRVC